MSSILPKEGKGFNRLERQERYYFLCEHWGQNVVSSALDFSPRSRLRNVALPIRLILMLAAELTAALR